MLVYYCSSYEDDFEPDEDSPAPTPKPEETRGEGGVQRGEAGRIMEQRKKPDAGAGDDIYDFTPSDLGYWASTEWERRAH